MPNVPPPKPVFIEGEEVDPSLLTPEERAGFDEFDDFDPDAEIPATDEDDTKGDSGSDDELEADPDAGDDAAAAAADDHDDDDDAKAADQDLPADDDDQGGQDGGADADDGQDARTTVFRINDIPPETPPETNQARLDEIAGEISKIEADFEDGGMTTAEFRKQVSTLEREAGKIEAADEAKLSAYQERVDSFNAAVDQWKKDCAAFYKAHPEYKQDALANRDLNDLVRSLQGSTRGHIYDPALIEQAHEILQGRGGSRPAAQENKRDKPARERARTAPRNNPPNLGGLPVAEAGDVTEGEFSRLDAMLEAGKTADYEAALAQMTDAQRARYEAQG